MPKRQIERARHLRREPTDAEVRLWHHLRDRRLEGVKFRRQHPLLGYYLDFACEEARLVVEADGGQHSPEADAPRTRALEAAGYQVIRFWDHDVLGNTEGVVEEIRRVLRIALNKPLP